VTAEIVLRPLPIAHRFSREQAVLWNWYARVFQGRKEWQRWASEAFASLLQTPARTETRLVVKHSLEENKQDALHKLSGDVVTLGRSPENQIMLPAQSVTKQHARLIFENGSCYLEDLGSTLGTYVANQKLAPHKRISLAPGTQFTIFPYLLTVEEHFEWVSQTQVEISQPEIRPALWRDFLAQSSQAFVHFPVTVHPMGLTACIEVGRTFLEHLLNGMQVTGALAGLLPGDSELLGFLLLTVLERANRELRFPFQFLLGKPLERPSMDAGAQGIACSFSVAWTGFTGAFRFFLPDALMVEMQKAWPGKGATDWREFSAVSWRLPITTGYADLTAQEAADLEPGDIVLLTQAAVCGLSGDDGWLLKPVDAGRTQFTVDRFFQGRLLVETENSEAVEKNPDLSTLPVRLHVVLAEKEMTLAELGAMQSGSIIELDRDTSGEVDVALNGKLSGKGTLVEIEGKLGVKILSWGGGRE
jgi:flagellar motor switch/type III secretory pathway protein FliN